LKISLTETNKELKEFICNLEKMVLNKVFACASEIYTHLLECMDDLIERFKPKSFQVAHRRQVWYRTMLGTIRVTRRQYQDEKGNYRYLLDELLGMGKYEHTSFGVKEAALELADNMTFRQSADILRMISPIDISHQTIHRLLKRTADGIQAEADSALTWFLQTGELPLSEGKKVKRLIMEADGVMLPLQREKARRAEVKLGIAYEGWEKVGKDRYRTLNKTIHADITDPDTFWAGMALKLQGKYDLGEDRQIVMGGDGAEWIKDGADLFQARYQLCRYHFNRELCVALGHDRQKLSELTGFCQREEFDNALALLKEAAENSGPKKGQQLNKAINYMISNLDGLGDYRNQAEKRNGELRRTGAIEGNIDKLIVRRMKNRGMSWTYQGIRRMLWLRINKKEGTLSRCLQASLKETMLEVIPEKRINRVIDRNLKRDYSAYFAAGLPAISGPHASRLWVKMLKSLTGLAS
jgi:hypothetical protein